MAQLGSQENSVDWSFVDKIPAASASVDWTPEKIKQTAIDEASAQGVDPSLVLGLIKHESANFNPEVINGRKDSPAGAIGPGQLLASTASQYGGDPRNPEQNIKMSVTHLKGLLEQNNGDEKLALAAYNAGQGNVRKYGGIPPFKETQNYVPAVLSNRDAFQAELKPIDWSFADKMNTDQPGITVAQTPKELESAGVDPNTVTQQVADNFSWGQFLLQKAGAGATLGLYDGGMEGRTLPEKAAGLAAEFAGGIPTFALLTTGLGELGFLGGLGAKAAEAGRAAKLAKTEYRIGKGLLAAGEDVVTKGGVAGLKTVATKATFKKLGVEAVKAGAEGAYIGAGVEGAKGAIRGENMDNILTDSIVGAVNWGVTGAALTPVMHGAGSFISRRGFGAVEKTAIQTGQNPLTVKLLNNIKEVSPDELSNFLTENSQNLTPEQLNGLIAIGKMKILKPTFSATPTEILASPDIFNAYSSKTFENIGRKAFLEPDSPLRFIYGNNENIKKLVDQGEFGKALAATHVQWTSSLRDAPDLQAVISSPFRLDAGALGDFVAQQFENTNKQKYGRFDDFTGLVSKWYSSPDADPLLMGGIDQTKIRADVEQALAASKPVPYLQMKKVSDLQAKTLLEFGPTALTGGGGYEGNFTKITQGGFKSKFTQQNLSELKNFNPTLNSRQIEDLVSKTISKGLKIVSGGKLEFNDLAMIQDTQKLSRAMVTFNQPLVKTLAQSFSNNNGHLADDYLVVEPELQKPVHELMKKNMYLSELEQDYAKLAALKGKVQNKQALKMGDAETIDANNSINNLYQSINYKVGEIKTIETGLKGTPEDQMAKAQNIANNAFLPNKADLSGSKEMSTQVFFQKFFPKDNPYLLKNNTELSEWFHAMSIAGHDMPKNYTFSLDSLPRKTQRQFGINNPLNKFFDQYKNITILKNNFSNSLKQEVNALEIPKGSKLSAIVQQYGEGIIDETHPSFTALSPVDQLKVKKASEKISGIYADLISNINTINKANNIPLINIKDKYFHHPQTIAEDLPVMIKNWLTGDVDQRAAMVKDGFFLHYQKPEGDMVKTFAGFEKRRTTGVAENPDAIGGILKYIDPASNRIFYQDLVRQVDAAKSFAPQNVGDLLKTFKDNYLLNLPHWVDEKTTPRALGQAIDRLRQRFSTGALLGNIGTLARQPLSIPVNFALSGKAGVKALMKMWTRDGELLWQQSKNNAFRNMVTEGHDVVEMKTLFDKIKNGIIKKGYDQYKGFLETALSFSDRLAAKQAFLTGYNHFIGEGLSHEQALKGADWWVNSTQADLSKIGSPEYSRTVLGRAITQFQSFSTNLFGTIMNDIPNISNTDGAAKAVSMILKGYATITMTNEVLKDNGLPSAFDINSFIPFLSGYKFGVAGPVGALWNSGKVAYGSAIGDKRLEKEGVRNLAYMAPAATGIAGAGQLVKTVKYLSSTNKKTSDADKISGALFGGSTVRNKLQKNQNQNRINNTGFSKEVKKLIRGY